MSPKIKSSCFGSRGHVQKMRNHRNDQFEALQEANQEVMRPNRSRILQRSFSAYYFYKFTIKLAQHSPKMHELCLPYFSLKKPFREILQRPFRDFTETTKEPLESPELAEPSKLPRETSHTPTTKVDQQYVQLGIYYRIDEEYNTDE